MVHELRIYTFHPGGLRRYLPLAGGVALAIRGPEMGLLRGFWLTQREGFDTAWHLWAYKSLDHRQAVREALAGDTRWNEEFLRHILPTLKSQEVRFLQPAGPELAAGTPRGEYRLDTHDAAPGQLPAVVSALAERLQGSDAQLSTGISPWPNSVTVLAGAASPDLPLPSGVTRRESVRMTPSYFSPLN
jgi:hypothetical protein